MGWLVRARIAARRCSRLVLASDLIWAMSSLSLAAMPAARASLALLPAARPSPNPRTWLSMPSRTVPNVVSISSWKLVRDWPSSCRSHRAWSWTAVLTISVSDLRIIAAVSFVRAGMGLLILRKHRTANTAAMAALAVVMLSSSNSGIPIDIAPPAHEISRTGHSERNGNKGQALGRCPERILIGNTQGRAVRALNLTPAGTLPADPANRLKPKRPKLSCMNGQLQNLPISQSPRRRACTGVLCCLVMQEVLKRRAILPNRNQGKERGLATRHFV